MKLRQTISLAWKILSYEKVRFTIAVGAVAFAILLMYSQIFILKGFSYSFSNFFNLLNADLVVLDKNRIAHQRFETFEKKYLAQIGAFHDEVESVTPIYWAWLHLDSPLAKGSLSITTTGIPPLKDVLLIPEVNKHIEELKKRNTIIVSSLSNTPLRNLKVGDSAKIDETKYKIAGKANIPLTPVEEGVLIMNESTFREIFNQQALPSYGLIKLKKGVDVEKFRNEKLVPLSKDLIFQTPNSLFWREVIYATKVTKVGIVFAFSLGLAVLVGTLINFQIIQNIIELNINQFATLKAIGFTNRDLTGIIFTQSILLGICSFLIATLLSYPLNILIRSKTSFLIPFGIYEPIFTFILALCVSSITGFFVSKKVLETDPAELF